MTVLLVYVLSCTQLQHSHSTSLGTLSMSAQLLPDAQTVLHLLPVASLHLRDKLLQLRLELQEESRDTKPSQVRSAYTLSVVTVGITMSTLPLDTHTGASRCMKLEKLDSTLVSNYTYNIVLRRLNIVHRFCISDNTLAFPHSNIVYTIVLCY